MLNIHSGPAGWSEAKAIKSDECVIMETVWGPFF